MPIVKAKSDVKQRIEQQKHELLQVSDEAQNRLAEILADAPTLEKLAGTEWEVRALRIGTMHLIVNEVCKINKADSANYGDILKAMTTQIPSTVGIFTLALLNDKNKIYQNGDPNQGYSKLYKKTYDTITWNANEGDLMRIMFDCLQKINVDFFMGTLDMLQIFRESVTLKKRTRRKTQGQK